jgi:hypothetical protein
MEMVILKKPVVAQPHKKFAEFYGAQRYVTVSIGAHHWPLS